MSDKSSPWPQVFMGATLFGVASGVAAGIGAALRGNNVMQSIYSVGMGTSLFSSCLLAADTYSLLPSRPQTQWPAVEEKLALLTFQFLGMSIGSKLFMDAAASTVSFGDVLLGDTITIGALICAHFLWQRYYGTKAYVSNESIPDKKKCSVNPLRFPLMQTDDKTAVELFFDRYGEIKKSSFWFGKNLKNVTLEEIITHAKGNNMKFFGTHSGGHALNVLSDTFSIKCHDIKKKSSTDIREQIFKYINSLNAEVSRWNRIINGFEKAR